MFNDDYSIIFSQQELVERNECNAKSQFTFGSVAGSEWNARAFLEKGSGCDGGGLVAR
jgi:hypothetical protein